MSEDILDQDKLFQDDDDLVDEPGEGSSNYEPELEKIRLVYDGEVAKELELPKELAESLKQTDAWEEINRLMHAGLLWNKRQHEYGELKRQIETLNSLFQKAREDDDALEQLKAHIEAAIGRPLTAKEQRQLDDNIDEPDELYETPIVKKLQAEIESLKKQQEELLLKEEQKRLEAEIKALESKYDGSNGFPKFDREEVLNFAVERGIADIELAYKIVNFDKLNKTAQQKVAKQLKEREKKIKDATSLEKDGSPATIKKTEKTPRTYTDVTQEVLKEMKEQGINLFEDE